MTLLDYAIVTVYFVVTVSAGMIYRKLSSTSMKSYFLGDNSASWWALAMSGSASNYSVCGTVWMISVLFGSPDEVAKQAKWLCDTIGKDGGFILSTCNILTNMIPADNAIAMYGVER